MGRGRHGYKCMCIRCRRLREMHEVGERYAALLPLIAYMELGPY